MLNTSVAAEITPSLGFIEVVSLTHNSYLKTLYCRRQGWVYLTLTLVMMSLCRNNEADEQRSDD